jgi:hypothetical protein
MARAVSGRAAVAVESVAVLPVEVAFSVLLLLHAASSPRAASGVAQRAALFKEESM